MRLKIRAAYPANLSVPSRHAGHSITSSVLTCRRCCGKKYNAGYPPGAFSGDQYHALRLEYRFPVWWAEAAYKTIPAFFRRLQAGVFTDNVLITFDSLDTDDWRSSVGGELVET